MNALRGHVEQQQLAPQQQEQKQQDPAVLAQIAAQNAPQKPTPRRSGPTAEQLRAASLGAPPQMANQLEKMAKSMETRQLHQEKLSAQERKEQRADMRENKKIQFQVDKLTKPDYDKIVHEAEAAKDDDRRLGRMKEIVHKGDLSSPALGSLFKTASKGIWGFGVDLSFLQSADSQEFNKLSKDFIKNAKSLFGARITDNELKLFLETIPDLSQSSEGILRIIHNMELANKAKYIKEKAAKAVMKEHGGHRPLDFLTQVAERSDKELDALAKEFSKGLAESKKLKREPRGIARDLGGIVLRGVGLEK